MCTASIQSNQSSLTPNQHETCRPILLRLQLFLLISFYHLSLHTQAKVFVQLVTSQIGEALKLNISQWNSLIFFTKHLSWHKSRGDRKAQGADESSWTACHKRPRDTRTVSSSSTAQNTCLSCQGNFTLISCFELIPLITVSSKHF